MLLITELVVVIAGSGMLLLFFASGTPPPTATSEVHEDGTELMPYEIFKLRMNIHLEEILLGLPNWRKDADRISRGTFLFLKHLHECGQKRPEAIEIDKAMEAVHIVLEGRPIPPGLSVVQRMLVDYWVGHLRRLKVTD
jgi:hypothetical protein